MGNQVYRADKRPQIIIQMHCKDGFALTKSKQLATVIRRWKKVVVSYELSVILTWAWIKPENFFEISPSPARISPDKSGPTYKSASKQKRTNA